MISWHVSPQLHLELMQPLPQEVLEVLLLSLDLPLQLMAGRGAGCERLLEILELLPQLLQLQLLLRGQLAQGLALHLRLHRRNGRLVLGDVTLQLSTALLVLTNKLLLASCPAFRVLHRLAGRNQRRPPGASVLLQLPALAVQLVQLAVGSLSLLLDLHQSGPDCFNLVLGRTQLLSLRQPHEAGGVLEASSQCAPAADLVPFQGYGIQAMLSTHLITQLQGGAHHSPAKDLLNRRKGPFGAADDVDQRLHSGDLRILSRLHLQLVQRRAHDAAQTALAHQ
mmetsp:Transcript_93836/g.223125  ORF Transcript_93836/g.223125 Transcript_93836/m.223125 type:complete len:281 (+) Transcript_93836:1110-1952(+)